MNEKIYEKSDCDDFPMKPQRIVSDIRKIMGYHDIIALDMVFIKFGSLEITKHSNPTQYY